MQEIKKGEIAEETGVIVSYKDYRIIQEHKELLEHNKRLHERLDAGEDV